MTATVRIQEEPFDAGALIAETHSANPKVGAVATFLGLVRDINAGADVAEMTLEHYPGMTERAIENICRDAAARWEILDTRIVHRVGTLRPTDPIVIVVVASGHRRDALDACAFIMDFLKTRAPFWKKERTGDGERWVQARASDDEAAARWK
ncbi:MAG: molybdenum cofactor biosynthesis protein MoaE [Thiotrichales bacterium]|nr:molybdenum cofactor biosynthesis protein MoaE [Thiotrichales bacterium]